MTMSEAQNETASSNGSEKLATSSDVSAAQNPPKAAYWQATPELDVYESASEYLIRLDVPGADPSSVDVQVDGTELHIKAQQAPSARYSDVALASFQRHLELPGEVDAQSASATLTDGVLEIRISKSLAARRVRIPVSTN
jgi:HSP20 family protein